MCIAYRIHIHKQSQTQRESGSCYSTSRTAVKFEGNCHATRKQLKNRRKLVGGPLLCSAHPQSRHPSELSKRASRSRKRSVHAEVDDALQVFAWAPNRNKGLAQLGELCDVGWKDERLPNAQHIMCADLLEEHVARRHK